MESKLIQVAIAKLLAETRSRIVPQPNRLEVMAMTILSDFVLVESKSTPENQLKNVFHAHALEIFSQTKTLYVALCQGSSASTTLASGRVLRNED